VREAVISQRAGDSFTIVLPAEGSKVAAAELGHKSEHDAVRLGLMSSDEVTTAVDDMLATVRRAMPSLVFDGILLQEQVDQTHELLLGLRRDPLIGPVITIGMGGFYAELERDPVLRRAPVSTDEANAMIREIETLSRRSGFRGAATIDLEALSAAVAAFSQLGAFPEILEAEINPLLMNGNGKSVLAVDGLLVLSSEMPEAVCL
jgi:hypothetical protein